MKSFKPALKYCPDRPLKLLIKIQQSPLKQFLLTTGHPMKLLLTQLPAFLLPNIPLNFQQKYLFDHFFRQGDFLGLFCLFRLFGLFGLFLEV